MTAVITKPSIRVISTDTPDARTHLSLDGKMPICGQHAWRPFRKRKPGTKVDCKPCREVVRIMSRKLRRPL